MECYSVNSCQGDMLRRIVTSNSCILNEQVEHHSHLFSSLKYEDRSVMEAWNYSGYTYFYHKYPFGLNEFIGEGIANKINLSTAHYEPVYFKGSLMIRTPDFRDTRYNYFNLMEIFANESCGSIEVLREKLNLSQDDVNDVLKMIALDIFMKQTDRSCVNIMVKQDKRTKKYSIAPIFDYSYAYPLIFDKYCSEVIDLKMDKEDVHKKMDKYPKFYEYLKLMLQISILDLLKEFASRYNLTLTDDVISFYKEEEEKSKIMINKIL